MQSSGMKAYLLVKDIPAQVQTDNIRAAMTVASIVKTCLGPRAMQKMVLTRIGSIELTNDGNSILREIDVAHPAAKTLIELSKTQDEEVGDGTTSVILLAAQILNNMADLLENIHPIKITQALSKGLNMCLESMKLLTVDLKKEEEEKLNIIRSTVGTKLCSLLGIKMEELAYKAVKNIYTEIGGVKRIDIKNDLRVEKIIGNYNECEILNGILLNKNIIHPQMRKEIINPRILVIDFPLEYKKGESQTNYEFRNAEAFKRALEIEEENIKEMCDKIIELKPDILLTEKGISDYAMSLLFSNNITAIRRIKKTESNRMVKACGGMVVGSLEDLSEKVIGTRCKLFKYLKIGEEYYCKFDDCVDAKACSVILKAPSKDLINELERNFYDAVKVAKNLFLFPKMCPGGGATEMSLSLMLEKFKGNELEEKVLKRLAEALQIIPIILAKNSGVSNPLALMQLLEKKQKENKFNGIDGVKGEVIDVRGRIMEPVVVKVQMLKSAIEAANVILRVDGVIHSGSKNN